MTPTVEAFATVAEDGSVTIKNRKRFDAELREFFGGKEVVLTVEKVRNRRSGQANRYLFGVVYRHALRGFAYLGNEGVTVMDVHEFFKKLFLTGRELVIDERGTIAELPASSRKLTKQEFWEYIGQIKRWSLENLQTQIPDPHEEITEFNIG